MYLGMSFAFTGKSSGPKMEHCGTPDVTGNKSENAPSQDNTLISVHQVA